MNESYHKSARTQDPQFLGTPQVAAENQRLPALCERDAGATGETTPVSRTPWTCPYCGELLQLIRVYPSGRGFEMRCNGTDSNPHRATMYVGPGPKEEILRMLDGALYRC